MDPSESTRDGKYEEKFPQARAMYLYMMVHPGKKLNFMGNEIGQLREWDEKRQQDWDLLKYPSHDSFCRFMQDLNQVYLDHPALYSRDYCGEGFSWIDCHQEDACVYAISRKTRNEELIAVFNFGGEAQEYELPQTCKNGKILLRTDWEKYGGKTAGTAIQTKPTMTLTSFSGLLYQKTN